MVTVRERLAAPGPHFSVEFLPPRDDAEESALWLAIRRLEPLRPAFVSVTYGAGGSRRDRTVRITERIAAETTLLPVAHLTAVGHSVADLRHVIGSYASVGVRNILALRGDPPGEDPTAEWVAHPQGLNYASDLVALTKSLGDFHVGVAAFPDSHPRSPDLDSDTRYFAEKVTAGADYAITQMFFRPEDYLQLRDRVAAIDPEQGRKPIVPGIMPITSLRSVQRMAELSGKEVPPEVIERLERAAGTGPTADKDAVREEGVQVATELSERLIAEGVPCLHFYTLNFSRATVEVLTRLGMVGAAV